MLEVLFIATPIAIIGIAALSDRPFISITKDWDIIFFQKPNTIGHRYEYNPSRPYSYTSPYVSAR